MSKTDPEEYSLDEATTEQLIELDSEEAYDYEWEDEEDWYDDDSDDDFVAELMLRYW